MIESSFSILCGGAGASLVLVARAICLVNSDNKQHSGLLSSYVALLNFLEEQAKFNHKRLSNNGSVMPFNVQGCVHTTVTGSVSSLPSCGALVCCALCATGSGLSWAGPTLRGRA